MTDQEIICTFMVDPTKPGYFGGWWTVIPANGVEAKPVAPQILTLDALWEVEERLKKAGVLCSSRLEDHPHMVYTGLLLEEVGVRKWEYCDKQWGYHGNPHDFFAAINAKPEQKIKALATVLRPLVEKEMSK